MCGLHGVHRICSLIGPCVAGPPVAHPALTAVLALLVLHATVSRIIFCCLSLRCVSVVIYLRNCDHIVLPSGMRVAGPATARALHILLSITIHSKEHIWYHSAHRDGLSDGIEAVNDPILSWAHRWYLFPSLVIHEPRYRARWARNVFFSTTILISVPLLFPFSGFCPPRPPCGWFPPDLARPRGPRGQEDSLRGRVAHA